MRNLWGFVSYPPGAPPQWGWGTGAVRIQGTVQSLSNALIAILHKYFFLLKEYEKDSEASLMESNEGRRALHALHEAEVGKETDLFSAPSLWILEIARFISSGT